MSKSKVAIVGSGPAGLMAATQLVLSGKSYDIHLFEKRSGFGRKLLIAGSSGLNISHEHSIHDFSSHYTGWDAEFWKKMLKAFGPKEWIAFIEKELGLETFLGTSERYFVKEMKASGLLKKWIHYLEEKGVTLHSQHELSDFSSTPEGVTLSFNQDDPLEFDAAAFFLGGGSWEEEEPSWMGLFRQKNIHVIPFEASNVGYEVKWSETFLAESEGKPLKKVELQTSRGKKLGELVITRYGIEGTPVYFTGVEGEAFLDLKPDLTLEQVRNKMTNTKENLNPMRRVKHLLGLNETAESLIFHHAPAIAKTDLETMIATIKNFPITLVKARPLSESISSRGGVDLSELSPTLELMQYPGIFCGGEMLDWDAPTGGFLIQACVSQGASIARNLS